MWHDCNCRRCKAKRDKSDPAQSWMWFATGLVFYVLGANAGAFGTALVFLSFGVSAFMVGTYVSLRRFFRGTNGN